MPTRRKGEKKSDYISRCISHRQHEGKDVSQKQSVAVCYSMAGEGVQGHLRFKEFLIEASEVQRLHDEIGALYKQLERIPKTIGLGREPDPRYRRLKAMIRAKVEQLNILKSRVGAREEIETGRQMMQNAPPSSKRSNQQTPLSSEDVEAAIRTAIEELTQGSTAEEARVSGEMVSDWIRRHFGEYIDRRRIDKELSENPNLMDLEKFRKIGRIPGVTDFDRETRYLRNQGRR